MKDNCESVPVIDIATGASRILHVDLREVAAILQPTDQGIEEYGVYIVILKNGREFAIAADSGHLFAGAWMNCIDPNS